MEWQLERDRLRALPCPSLLALRFFALHEMIPQYLNLGRRDNGQSAGCAKRRDGGDIEDKCESASYLGKIGG